jgi:hypothetical protein
MGFYYDQNSSADSPVVVLQPQHPSQRYGMKMNNHSFNDSAFFSQPSPAPTSWAQSQPQTPLSSAGRKRSRDEAADNLEDDYFAPVPAPVQESEEEWEYGEGMTLIKPNGFIIDASSQTGTWAEEKAEIAQLRAVLAQTPTLNLDRPALRSHKSQRLDLTATPKIEEEISLSNGMVVASSPPKSTGMEEPTVDDFTMLLGIGWSRISDDVDIQAAARGWAKFIENHYPVSHTCIRLHSRGLECYLVEAREGWFLFTEDLKEGRLVSTSLERTLENLKHSEPEFEGEQMMMPASGSPDMERAPAREIVEMQYASQLVSINGGNGIHNSMPQIEIHGNHASVEPAGQVMEMEMDMS